MRKALNDNPMVQIAVVGVLVLVVGLFLMTTMSKKSPSDSAATAAPATAGAAPAAGTTAPVVVPDTGATAAPSATAGATPSVSANTGTVPPEALIPGPGLPAPLIKAWKGGDAVALLIDRSGGIDDKLVHASVQELSGETGAAVFVARAEHVARYARITQGVGVNRAPALVVVRPRRNSGSVPEAQVSYGFRNSTGVVQAVHNALYSGPDDLPYHPR